MFGVLKAGSDGLKLHLSVCFVLVVGHVRLLTPRPVHTRSVIVRGIFFVTVNPVEDRTVNSFTSYFHCPEEPSHPLTGLPVLALANHGHLFFKHNLQGIYITSILSHHRVQSYSKHAFSYIRFWYAEPRGVLKRLAEHYALQLRSYISHCDLLPIITGYVIFEIPTS